MPGVNSTDGIDYIYDTSFAIGGPIKRDKLWFWTAHRLLGLFDLPDRRLL